MNSKKCRQIRQEIRKQLKNNKLFKKNEEVATYDEELVRTPFIVDNLDGTATRSNMFTKVLTLKAGCPREIYKDYKKKLKNMGF